MEKIIIKAGHVFQIDRFGRKPVIIVLKEDIEVDKPDGWDDPMPDYITKYKPMQNATNGFCGFTKFKG